MPRYLMLRAPSANRVYAGSSAPLAEAELALTAPFASGIGQERIAGISYLGFEASELDADQLGIIARQSSCFALFRADGTTLHPVELPPAFVLDEDLVTIPKYQGKTNEQFTQLLVNLTLAAVTRTADGPRQILDPMAGRGTTLSTALLLGHDAYGVEAEPRSFEQMASFYTTYLRRKRIKHTAGVRPVRREGRTLGERFDAELTAQHGKLRVTVFTGDARDSASLFGKKRFDAIVTDAPYGIVHGAATDTRRSGRREHSPAELLRETVPVWAGQLRLGGALGISWNTLRLDREELATMLTGAGLTVMCTDAWRLFSHRVDNSITRDLIVAVKPRDEIELECSVSRGQSRDT